MAYNSITYKLHEGELQFEFLKELKAIYSAVFKDADLYFFIKRLAEKEDILIVVAYNHNEIIGFKIGYRYDATTFYSWVGGVLESFRKQGIGKQLANLQETNIKEKGYTKLRTKSMNRFKPMMILNLKNGFNIVKVYTNEKGQTKIVFEKNISVD